MNVLVLVLSLMASERTLVDRVIAVVNDEVITQSELDATMAPYLEGGVSDEKRKLIHQNAMDSLIAEKLIGQQIREARIDITEDDLDRAIDEITKQNRISRDELKQAVEARGMSMAQYKDDLTRQLQRLKLVEQKVRSRVIVPDADVKAEWERQVGLEKREKMVKLSHLFFSWGETADAAEKKRIMDRAKQQRERIAAGAKFGEVAKEVSQGPTAAEGGELGWLGMQDLLPELAREVNKMSAGQLSEPIETANGVHVVFLEDAKLKEPTGFETARAQIYNRLYQQEVDRQMRLWIDELKATSAIEIRGEPSRPAASNK